MRSAAAAASGKPAAQSDAKSSTKQPRQGKERPNQREWNYPSPLFAASTLGVAASARKVLSTTRSTVPSRRVDAGDDEALAPIPRRSMAPPQPQPTPVSTSPTTPVSIKKKRQLDRMESFCSHSTSAELAYLASDGNSVCSRSLCSSTLPRPSPPLARIPSSSTTTRHRLERQASWSSLSTYARHRRHDRLASCRPDNPMAEVLLRRQMSTGSLDTSVYSGSTMTSHRTGSTSVMTSFWTMEDGSPVQVRLHRSPLLFGRAPRRDLMDDDDDDDQALTRDQCLMPPPVPRYSRSPSMDSSGFRRASM